MQNYKAYLFLRADYFNMGKVLNNVRDVDPFKAVQTDCSECGDKMGTPKTVGKHMLDIGIVKYLRMSQDEDLHIRRHVQLTTHVIAPSVL